MGCIGSSRGKEPPVSVLEKTESTYDPRLSIIGGGTHPNNLNKVFNVTTDSIGQCIQWDDQEEILSALISQLPEDTYTYPFTKYTLVVRSENGTDDQPIDDGQVRIHHEEKMYVLVDTKGWKSLITSNFLTISEVGYYTESKGSNQEVFMRLFYVTTNKENGSINLVTPVIQSNKISLEVIDLTKEMKEENRTLRIQAKLKQFLEGVGQRNVFNKVPGDGHKIWHFAFKLKQVQLYWTVQQGRIGLTSKREEASDCRMENLTQSINFD